MLRLVAPPEKLRHVIFLPEASPVTANDICYFSETILVRTAQTSSLCLGPRAHMEEGITKIRSNVHFAGFCFSD